MRQYTQYKIADFLCGITPRRFAYWVGLRTADLFYSRDTAGRNAVKVNLRHVLEYRGAHVTEDRLDRLARKTFQYFGKYLVDFLRTARLTRRQLDRQVSIEHMEYLEEAEAANRGVLLVTGHIGSWEMGAAVLTALGRKMNAVVLPQPDQQTRALFRDHREGRGIRVIPLGSAARGTLKALARKEAVAVLADRDYSDRNDLVTFCGTPARFPKGPAVLSIRTGAPLLPAFLLRQVDDDFVLRFHPPIFPSGHSEKDLQEKMCRILEWEILRNPCQWFMFQKFWGQEGGGVPGSTVSPNVT